MENHSGTGVPSGNVQVANPKPWEDLYGNPLSEDNLRFVSKYWSKETWEQYLQTIETPQTEYMSARFGDLLYQNDLQRSLSEHFATESQQCLTLPSESVSTERLEEAIASLTLRERQTIQAIFHEGLSQAEAAKVMRLSKSRVHLLLRSALRKLRSELTPVA